jgi:prepilin-type N-terminal cleavage/methylation domain-containing protein
VYTWVSGRIRQLRSAASDEGFTLVEMVVALIVFALVAQALAGVLMGSARGQLFAQNNTTAKNFAQQQVDSMRSLPYHVDAQNGPYVDLLDLYFPNAVPYPATTTIPNVIPGQTVQGSYVASAAATATNPAGPYYQVTIPGSKVNPTKLASYTQVVYTQFLNANSPAATPISASLIPSGYNNSTVGTDLPVSPLLGVTVVTSWALNGAVHNLKTFTEISNEGSDTSLVVNQAKSAAVRILTQDRNKNAITVTLASVTANGSVSNSSSSGATALGASVVYTDATNPLSPVRAEVDGEKLSAASPPNPGGTSGQFGQGASGVIPAGASGCGWADFAPTQVSDVTSTTASGLPVVPSDATPNPTSPTVTAALQSNGGGPCAGMYFSNQIDSVVLTNPALLLNPAFPMVQLEDVGGGSSAVTGQASIYTAATGGAPGAASSQAASGMFTWLKIFPGLPFVPATTPGGANYPVGSPGLVNVKLTAASLSCQSVGGQTGATSQAVLTYTGVIAWWTYNAVPLNGWHTAPFTFTTASTTDPLAGIGLNLASPLNSTGTSTLSTYITSVVGATGAAPSDGVQSVEAAVAITTVPTLPGATLTGSALGVELGHLSCVALDNR